VPWEGKARPRVDCTVKIVKRSDVNMPGNWLSEGQELTEEQVKTFRGDQNFEVVEKRWAVNGASFK
jgi:hypothetical protein